MPDGIRKQKYLPSLVFVMWFALSENLHSEIVFGVLQISEAEGDHS